MQTAFVNPAIPQSDAPVGWPAPLSESLDELDQREDGLLSAVDDAPESSGVAAPLAGERLFTVEQLARKLNVSTKTISRWRRRGLVGQRFLVGGRERVGFLESSVARFVERNTDRVRRGSEFSQMSDRERASVVEDALCLIRGGKRPGDVIDRLARQTGRSVETIRYTLKRFDREHPDAAVLANGREPLDAEAKAKILQGYLGDESVEALAERFRRTRVTICRVIAEMRAERIFKLPLDYVANERFDQVRPNSAKERKIVGPPPADDKPPKKSRPPKGVPPYLAALYEVPLLTREQETHLFRKMNYLKYKASHLRDRLDPSEPSGRRMGQIERCHREAVETARRIIRANLRLVVWIAKRHAGGRDDFFELISDGNVSLMRAVEKFDFARGTKFSTYACWALMKNFARTIPSEQLHRRRFRAVDSGVLASVKCERADEYEQQKAHRQRACQVKKILGHLSERERSIIVWRFGLWQDERPRTLEQVGVELGVSKERVRQIEARALRKLRKAFEEKGVSSPGWVGA